MTVTVRRLSSSLQVDGFPDGPRYVRPDETRLLAFGYQGAEMFHVPEDGPPITDGYAYPTPDETELRLRAGSHGWHAAPFAALRSLVAGLSTDPIACVEVEN